MQTPQAPQKQNIIFVIDEMYWAMHHIKFDL